MNQAEEALTRAWLPFDLYPENEAKYSVKCTAMIKPADKENLNVTQPTAVIFYVADIGRSSKFYSDLFDLTPTVASAFYVMFKLDNGFEIAINDRNKLQPAAAAMSASAELCFLVADRVALDSLHAQWVQKGIQIIMPPAKMYFGGVHFMGLDPDGHRLRVGTPD